VKGAAWLVVVVVAFVGGGWAVPVGASLNLPPVQVYVCAIAGSLAGMAVFLLGGEKVQAWLTRGRTREPDPDSRLRQFVDRHGARGLGLVGPTFPGVTASIVLGLALGVDKRALARWMTIGIVVLFAVYTAGLWFLIDVVGLE
jgi:hypothetical protein